MIKTGELFSNAILNYKVQTKEAKVKYINLDNAATTSPLKCVEKDLNEFVKTYGSVHRGGGYKSKKSTELYENARENIKNLVASNDDDYLIFTGNTTGAINTIAHFFSYLKGKVAVSEIEHSSSWLPWIKSEGEKIAQKKQVDIEDLNNLNENIQEKGKKQVIQYSIDKNFEFDLAEIEKILKNNKIKVFVLTASSNVTGYCPDIKKIGEIVHKYGAYFLVDGCQFIQHYEINMQKMGIDFLVASGHKFYAPYGGGFLIGPKVFFDKFIPYQIGGGNIKYITKTGDFLRDKNQLSNDVGTPNAIGAITMSSALTKLKEIGYKNIQKHEKKITKKAYDYLKTKKNIKVLVSSKHLNTVIPFVVIGIKPSKVSEILNNNFGIGVRVGSFCSYNIVRRLLGIDDENQIIKEIKNGNTEKIPKIIRVSFSISNTEEDVETFIKAIEYISNKIKS